MTLKQGVSRQLLILVACVGLIAPYSWFVVRLYRAQRLADRSDRDSLEKAITLEPRNASYHDLLCRSMTFVSQQPERAVNECRRASELNPYSSSIWLDLAQVYFVAGDNRLNKEAIHMALAVDPTTPDTVWSVANFFLIQGDASEALQQFSIVLREEPSLATPVLNICWQSLHDIHRIQGILPPNPEVHLAFIKLLLSTGELEPASRIWSALIELRTSFDYHEALFYIDNLMRIRAIDSASEAWQQLAFKSKVLQAYSQPGNLVMDGSFSREILNSGFDWRYIARPQISVTLDSAEFHSGHRSLLLTYSQSGSDAGIFQYVAVKPGRRYRLSAWVKSEELKTANGPSLTLSDAYDNTIHASTEDAMGTTPWHRVETELQTAPETKLLLLNVLRSPGDTRIEGKLWIDDVKLEPL